jgi:hypothetical protein
MQSFLKFGSYIFHPLWLSTYAMVFYFFYSSFMFTYESMLAKLFAILILTVFLPILFLVLLKPLRVIENFHLSTAKERRIPLLFFTAITAFILNYIFDPLHFKIPFYFFSAVFFSGLVSIILSFLNYKISIHAIGISSITCFIIAFSLFYQIQGLFIICLSILATGWVLSSRMVMKAHSIDELISGLILGVLSQLVFIQFWIG